MERKKLPVSKLLIDVRNPRMDIQSSQEEAIQALAQELGGKIVAIAEDICEHGLSPIKNLFVMPLSEEKDTKYIVLDGNRRLTAIRLMESPTLAQNILGDNHRDRLEALSAAYRKNPIRLADSSIVPDRETGDRWIELEHTGENKGVGPVYWDVRERERWNERRGKKAVELKAIDLVLEKSDLPETTKEVIEKDIPITSVKRLINDPYVREKLGIAKERDEISIAGEEAEVVSRLETLFTDLALNPETKVKTVYYKEDRERYINALLSGQGGEEGSLAPPTFDDSQKVEEAGSERPSEPRVAVDEKQQSASEPKTEKSRDSSPTRKRTYLIPSDYRLTISNKRIYDIYRELKTLALAEFTNAVAVLLRVFLELSLDDFLGREESDFDEHASLAHKLNKAAEILQSKYSFTAHQLKPIRRVADNDRILAASVATFHAYVHHKDFQPLPDDLFVAWDALAPLMEQIWSS